MFLRIFPIQIGDHDPQFVVKRVHVSANDLMGIFEKIFPPSQKSCKKAFILYTILMQRTLKKLGFSIAFNMGALYVAVELLEEVNYTGGWLFFVVAGAIIGFLNVFVKPILKFLSLPLIFVSAGFFLIVINALIIWFTDKALEVLDFSNIDFQIQGVLNFILVAVIFGLVNWFEHWLFKRSR